MTTSAATTPIKADTPAPATSPPRPLLTRLHLWLRLWTLKLTIRTLLSTVRFFKIKGYGTLQPTYRKTYPIGARLMNEVWIPSSWKPGQSLPLYIDIHGGGFALGDPFHDDGWCNYLASKQNICVVSCDYRKSPGYFFPTQTNDLVEIITSILDDETLPVDKSKICIGGFSAGGNLSLSVAQHENLQGKIKGLCLWYPSTDFSGAEYDVLCNEALEAAKLFAAAEQAEREDGNVEEDDRQGVESWRKGGVWWEMVKGAQHGFNYIRRKEGGAERERERVTEMAYERAAAWLKREIYA
ncbi:alpha/beta-hydrolase [Aureobasidium pullulans]|uniref:Alpha/beta-hydrolase n=2 Tax=Aureobasidium pullulans TaxID=5580 RepID=A0A4S9PEV0_AURPU|nr:alpha/beta-hydrolase [Aureobasidium pullulans]THZ39950.1 alpha/beta-hydrolase [Aureobasidium pullulans]THZ58190.1 alpha/beta-hydrolase [Aureobasidium pullulans]